MVFAIGLGIALLSMDEIRKLERVADEENRGIVADDIPVAIFSVKLDGKASWVTFGIC